MSERKRKTAFMKHFVNEDFDYYHYKDSKARQFEYRNHDTHEIYFLISGKVTYLIEGRSYKLRAGDILLINSNELHKPVIDEEEVYERIIIWIKPDFLGKHSSGECNLAACFEAHSGGGHNLIRPSRELLVNIRNILMLLEECCGSSEFGSNVLKNAYLMEIVVYLNRSFTPQNNLNIQPDIDYNEKIGKLIKHINDNLDDSLHLDFLVAMFYTSKYHLLHEFKKHTGYSIHQYILQKRLIMAKGLLKEGKSVAEVCDECGFGDYSNFIRAFKKVFGVPPKKYSTSQDAT